MAREKISPSYYCWSRKIGDLRIYGASSERGAAKLYLSLKDEGGPCDFFRGLAPQGFLEENEAKNALFISFIEGALHNKAVSASFPMDVHGTPFQWKAWRAIAGIPFGMTRTYGEVAAMVGSPGGARAVGGAMGRNSLPVVFP